MLVMIKGAGDLATGIALRLARSGMDILMTELAKPLAVRRTVSFCEAVHTKTMTVENITAKRADHMTDVEVILAEGCIPVIVDPEAASIQHFHPDVVIDAILAKRNTGTKITDAPIVIGIGPGFTAGSDCHAVIESMRGHTLGRVIYKGSALPNTNIPGLIGGFAGERVLRAPDTGIFRTSHDIGDMVKCGDILGTVNDHPVIAMIDGMIRGLLCDETPIHKGVKCGDVDPRGNTVDYHLSSDKALAIGGGVLEAILNLSGVLKYGK